MKRAIFTPKVPDVATKAMVDTVAHAALADNTEIAKRLADQKAQQEAAAAELATRIATLGDIAAQLAPLRANANAEHARFQNLLDAAQQAINDLREQAAAAQAAADTAGVQAQGARDRAAAAIAAAKDAGDAAQQASADSTRALAQADQAKTAGTTARTDATGARASASTAQADAADAKTTASAAQATADQAAATATAAQAAAAAAATKADQAATALAALAARITTFETKTVTLRRAAPQLPLIAAGTVYEQAVTWTTPMPGADYTVEAIPSPGLAGKATVRVKAGSQTASGLTLAITASVLVVAGQTVDVTAYR